MRSDARCAHTPTPSQATGSIRNRGAAPALVRSSGPDHDVTPLTTSRQAPGWWAAGRPRSADRARARWRRAGTPSAPMRSAGSRRRGGGTRRFRLRPAPAPSSGRAPVRRCQHPTDSLPITADHRGVPHSRNGIHLRQLPNQVPVDPGAYVHGSPALPGVQRVVARCDGRSQVERIRRGECVDDRCRDQRAGRRRLDRPGPGVAPPRSPDGTLTRPRSGAPAARLTVRRGKRPR